MEQITERESENVTSARQRVFIEDTFGYKNSFKEENLNYKPIEEHEHVVEKNTYLTHYNKWQRPSHSPEKPQF